MSEYKRLLNYLESNRVIHKPIEDVVKVTSKVESNSLSEAAAIIGGKIPVVTIKSIKRVPVFLL